jgi:hypothetical protein
MRACYLGIIDILGVVCSRGSLAGLQFLKQRLLHSTAKLEVEIDSNTKEDQKYLHQYFDNAKAAERRASKLP